MVTEEDIARKKTLEFFRQRGYLKMNDWKPEVGQVCEFSIAQGKTVWGWCIYHGKTRAGLDIYETDDGTIWAEHEVWFRPITTKADKYRDEQIEKINNQLAIYGFERVYSETGEHLYKQGVRVIAPGEYVVKALTDEQIDSIVNNNSHATSSGWRVDGEAIARAVQRELGIEV